MQDLKKYFAWQQSQIQKATEVFSDPFSDENNGIIPEFDIAFKHTHFLGGTSDSVLLGKNPYKSKAELYEEIINPQIQENKFVFMRGKFAEEFVARSFEVLTHQKVVDGIEVYGKHDVNPYSMAQIDRLIALGNEKYIPLEIKTSTFKRDEEDGKGWGTGCKFNDYGDLIFVDSKIPEYYYIQCQKQMWLYGVEDYMYLAAWITSENQIRVYQIHRNDDVIEQIKQAEEDFMFNHLIPNIPPEVEEVTLNIDYDEENNALVDSSFIDLAKEYQDLSKQATKLDKQKKDLAEQIKKLMGESTKAVSFHGEVVCTLTKQERTTLDTKALANEHPDLVKQYYKTTEVAPRLTIKLPKEK